MTFQRIAAASLLAIGMAGAAQAENLYASDPDGIVAFFFDEGYPAQLTTDGVGDPLIDFRANGDEFSLFFYDCEENTDCLSLQFYSGYQTEFDVSLADFNVWNTDRRFTRAYMTEEGSARIEMDISTNRGGITQEDFAALLELWLDRVSEFEDFIDW